MDLSTIVVSTNEAHFVRPCLAALRQGSGGLRAELLVVDNACSDGSAAVALELFPQARILRNEGRYGVARSRNVAMKRAVGRYFVQLDADTEVEPGTLTRLADYLKQRPAVGLAGPRLVNPDGTRQHSPRRFPTLRSVFFRWLPRCPESVRRWAVREYLMLDSDHVEAGPVDWVLGACLFGRRAAAEQVGLMDEGFLRYCEDIDWCYRMWQVGWEVHYVPEAVVMHHYQRLSARRIFDRTTWLHSRSLARLFLKRRWGRVAHLPLPRGERSRAASCAMLLRCAQPSPSP